MDNKKGITDLTSLQRIIINEPNQRFILWIIATDPKAFSIHFHMEIVKQQELLIPGKAPNLAKALSIFQNMVTKKMVDNKNALITKITWRGKIYRVYTHPFFIPFIALVGVIATVIGIVISTPSKEPPVAKPVEQLPKQKSQQIYPDSSEKKSKIYTLKNDSAGK